MEKMYSLFGNVFISELNFDQLTCISNEIKADHFIRYANLRDEWKNPLHTHNYYYENDSAFICIANEILMKINKKGIYVQMLKNGTEELAVLYVLGTGIAIFNMYNGIFLLHGSAVRVKDQAVVLLGHSGAGKSTTARALTNNGAQLISDDVIKLSMESDGNCKVESGYPHQKLWSTSLDLLNIHSSKLDPLLTRPDKYKLAYENFELGKWDLKSIIILSKHNYKQISTSQLSISNKIMLIAEHTFRSIVVEELGLQEAHFRFVCDIVNKCDIVEIYRPLAGNSIKEMCSLIMKEVIENGEKHQTIRSTLYS